MNKLIPSYNIIDIYNDPSMLKEIATEVQVLGIEAMVEKKDALLASFGSKDDHKNQSRITKLLEGFAYLDGELIDFEDFAEKVNKEITGIVLTAHPTFSLSEQGRKAMHLALNGNAEALTANIQIEPSRSPTLEEEYGQSESAIIHLRAALTRIWKIIYNFAAEHYPENWLELNPKLVTLATWVGFDLDGRTDISWTKSLEIRYRMALMGIEHILHRLSALGETHDREVLLELITATTQLKGYFQLGNDTLSMFDGEDDPFALLNRLAVESLQDKMATIKAIDDAFDTLLTKDLPLAYLIELATLRTEWRSIGIGLSHIHFRLNSAQLHNAIRAETDIHSAPASSASRRHSLKAVNHLLDKVKPVNIHYGTLAYEMTTARRVFMLAWQFAKHFDRRTPIRLLIAESDTSFTMLVALYFARLFNVDDYVEISPLFETEIGLQRGDKVIGELIENKHFLAYIRSQGKFCVQLGFSDSGRYIGQIAASLAIERFKIRLVNLWKKHGLDDIKLVFFDTHGESIGRGAHPTSLSDRFLNTHTPEVRKRLEAVTPYKHEVSFQGGDGYLWFSDADNAFAVITDLLEARIAPKEIAVADPFYQDNDWALDFFLTLKEKQANMCIHPGYLELINALGTNFLYPTGSRASKRQGLGSNVIDDISRIRAIPNNAILHQLGYLSNTVHGMGAAMGLDPDKATEMMQKSPRFKRLISMYHQAVILSDLGVLDAYIKVLNAGFWLDLADTLDDPELRKGMSRLSSILEKEFNATNLSAIFNEYRRDTGLCEDILNSDITLNSDLNSDSNSDPSLLRLHSIRIALIGFIFMKALQVPDFSNRSDMQLSQIVVNIVHLNMEEALQMLRDIFPETAIEINQELYGEAEDYVKEAHGYSMEHQTLFNPMEEAFQLIQKISAVIALKVKAYG